MRGEGGREGMRDEGRGGKGEREGMRNEVFQPPPSPLSPHPSRSELIDC